MKKISILIHEKVKDSFLLIGYLFWLLLGPCKFKKIKKDKIKKVLIIGLGAFGELLQDTPLLPALKKALNCDISFMVGEGKEVIFKNNPYVSEVLTYEESFKQNVKKLREKQFDLVFLLYPVSTKFALMCLFSGIKYRIGEISSPSRGPAFFMTRRMFPITKKSPVEQELDMIRMIGIDNENPKIEFYISKEEERNAKEKLQKIKVRDYVIVHPGFGLPTKYKYPSRLWPLERYAKVVDYIVEKYKLKVLLTGGEDERFLTKEIIKNVGNRNRDKVITTSGLFSFGELGYVVSKSKLLIVPDTSLAHLACAFDTKIIELEGIGDPKRYRPLTSKENCKVLFHPEVCTECGKPYCRRKTMECMKAISVEEVTKTVDELLPKALIIKK